MSPPKLQLKGVTKSFGAKHVLRGVDLCLDPAESYVVIGGSGTGKSVLLRAILGLTPPDAGAIFVDGEDVTRASAKRRAEVNRKFGMLFQNAALFDSLNVVDNIAFPLIHGQGRSKSQARAIACEALGKVGLTTDVGALEPSELSGGMRKRVGLARAIVARPEIIFFDEPTTGLDPIMSDVINDLIRTQTKELGATAITITHDLASAKKIADRVGMLYEGRIIWEGPIERLENSGDARVDQFIHGRAEGPIAVVTA